MSEWMDDWHEIESGLPPAIAILFSSSLARNVIHTVVQPKKELSIFR